MTAHDVPAETGHAIEVGCAADVLRQTAAAGLEAGSLLGTAAQVAGFAATYSS